MVIDFTGDVYIARCSFEERITLRRNLWRWNNLAKRWETDDHRKALALREFASPAALARIEEFEGELAEELAPSFATDSDRDFPVPAGLNPKNGKPFAYLGYQKGGIAFALDRADTLIADAPGLGKGHPYVTRVLTPKGWRFVGSLKLGDELIGSDGKPTPITAIFERGVLPTYRVTTNDGCSVVVDGDHLWSVWSDKRLDWMTRTTLELVSALAAGDEPFIPLISGPAYGWPILSEKDPFREGLGFAKPHAFNPPYERPLRPQRWSEGSVEQRKRFLAGIIQGKGEVGTLSDHLMVQVPHPTTFHAWVEEISAVVRSLGGLAFTRTRHEVHGAHVAIYLPEDQYREITGLRKTWTQRFDRLNPVLPPRSIVNITPRGHEPVRCLSVAADDQLYVCEGHIVTHNTIQAIGLSNALPADHRDILVVCPATLKINWSREFALWGVHDRTIGIAHTRSRTKTETENGVKVVRRWTERVFPDADIVIVNYELLPHFEEKIRERRWHILVVDEAQALQSEDSERTRQILGGRAKRINGKRRPKVRAIPAHRRLLLSGTPVTKRPLDLWPIIKAFDPNGLGKDFYQFAYRYCNGHEGFHGFDATGVTEENLPELQEYLRKTFMVRRTKDQVLKELPPKTRQIIELPAEGLQRQIKAEKDAFEGALLEFERKLGIAAPDDLDSTLMAEIVEGLEMLSWEEYSEGRLKLHLQAIAEKEAAERYLRRERMRQAMADQVDEAEIKKMMAEAMTALAAARQDLAIASLPMKIELWNRQLDADEPIIIFGQHTAIIDALLDTYPGAARIDGRVPTHKRQAEVDKFQEGRANVFIGQLRAAGTGLTLTRARLVNFAEITFVPTDLEQAEDRAHRISQLFAVLCGYPLVAGSLDMKMLGRVIERMGIIRAILDRAA